MKKPKYVQSMLAIIFMCLSIAFICVGVLCYVGLMSVKESSVIQTKELLGLIFSLLGLSFGITAGILKAVTVRKNKLEAELFAGGRRIEGTVECVYLQRNVQFGRHFPYRIIYSYSHMGNVYRRKSCLLWERPELVSGDSITVYADDSGNSIILP